jgi:transcriptional regulator with GAF, ATPase, and Fis domain
VAAPLALAEAVLADLLLIEVRDRATEAFERAFLSAALERHGGNVSATARATGLHRQSQQEIMRRLGLQVSSGGG